MSTAINAIIIYLGIAFVLSVVSFVAYGLDKRRAIDDGRRVSERTLHLLALLGGWPGALMGQRQFRHKTKKLPFLIIFWLVVALNVSILTGAAYFFFGSAIRVS